MKEESPSILEYAVVIVVLIISTIIGVLFRDKSKDNASKTSR